MGRVRRGMATAEGFGSRAGRRGLMVSVSVSLLVTLGALPGEAASAAPLAASVPLGDYAGTNDPAGVAEFASTTGAHLTMATDFLNRSSDWTDLESASVGAWAGSGYRLVLAVPMLPARGRTSLAQGARGAYNSHFVVLAENLVREGEGGAYLRLGWEFNGNWYKWRVRNARGAVAFAAYFRNIVTAMRSVPGQSFKFVWNPNADTSYGRYTPAEAYPGNAYVTYIGTDLYDEAWVQPLNPATAWARQLTGPWGLDWLSSFAAAEGKPIVFPEWGVAIRSDGHGLGDDPYYVNEFASWITTHAVAWTSMFCFDGNQRDDITDGGFPHTLAAFRADFG